MECLLISKLYIYMWLRQLREFEHICNFNCKTNAAKILRQARLVAKY